MDQVERDNWIRIAAEMEKSGVTEGGFYQRAKAIAEGKPDPAGTVLQALVFGVLAAAFGAWFAVVS